jgi:hypothetical protein
MLFPVTLTRGYGRSILKEQLEHVLSSTFHGNCTCKAPCQTGVDASGSVLLALG